MEIGLVVELFIVVLSKVVDGIVGGDYKCDCLGVIVDECGGGLVVGVVVLEIELGGVGI